MINWAESAFAAILQNPVKNKYKNGNVS